MAKTWWVDSAMLKGRTGPGTNWPVAFIRLRGFRIRAVREVSYGSTWWLATRWGTFYPRNFCTVTPNRKAE